MFPTEVSLCGQISETKPVVNSEPVWNLMIIDPKTDTVLDNGTQEVIIFEMHRNKYTDDLCAATSLFLHKSRLYWQCTVFSFIWLTAA